MNFNDYYWHDSSIKSINIDRSNPGVIDEISFKIDWINDQKGVLIFKDVYWASMNLNFGFVGEENILDASILDNNDPDLLNFYSSWDGLRDDIILKVFFIELNTSGSIIKILAKDYIIIDK